MEPALSGGEEWTPEYAHLTPGRLVLRDDRISKGNILTDYNDYIDIWSLKRIIRTANPRGYTYEMHYVDLDAVPDEGKDGSRRSHYSGSVGYGQTSPRAASESRWRLLSPTADAEFIATMRAEYAERRLDRQAAREAEYLTPERFSNRMKQCALALDDLAETLDHAVDAIRRMADDVRDEILPRH